MSSIESTTSPQGTFWNRATAILLWEIPVSLYDRWGLYLQSLLIVSFWATLSLRPAFTGHPISTGYAIAALALAAVVMAARADALTVSENIVWIALCAVLFIWELNVIDDEHLDQGRQHNADLAKIQTLVTTHRH
jgi:hypothetical protein